MNDKLKELFQPYWVEEQQGVYIPLIDKVLLKDAVPRMTYDDSMKYAKTNGVRIASKGELLQMYIQKDEINRILKEHDGDILNTWVGSSSQNGYYRYYVTFDFGCTGSMNKEHPIIGRAVADFKSKQVKIEQFNLEEYLKNPERKVVTRNGQNVRIICTDRKGAEDTIIALCLMSDGSKNCFFYPPDGKQYIKADSYNDLFFVPEKHEGWVNVYKDGDDHYIGSREFYSSEAEAVSHATVGIGYVKSIKFEYEE